MNYRLFILYQRRNMGDIYFVTTVNIKIRKPLPFMEEIIALIQ